MRWMPLILWGAVLHTTLSCSDTRENRTATEVPANSAMVKTAEAPVALSAVNAEELVKDFQRWYNYTYTNVRLAQDFVPLGTDSGKLTKDEFLSRLLTGAFIPVKRGLQEAAPVYQLVKPQNLSADVRSTMLQIAQAEVAHRKWEGKRLPAYRFTDLEGRVVDAAATRGKLLMLKCWFINCVACVAEFPELNELVEKHRNRNDVVFLSLATDQKEKLVGFLKKKPFHYAVVPEQGDYIAEKLQVSVYPTHVLVNREGRIVKMANSLEDILPVLEKELEKAAGPEARTGL